MGWGASRVPRRWRPEPVGQGYAVPTRAAISLGLSLLCGCGARSSLDYAGASDGAGAFGGDGGFGAAGLGGAGGFGGSGAGAPIPCDTFEWAGEPVLYGVGLAGEPTHLALVATSEELPTLAWIQNEADPNLVSTTFDGWGVWPPAMPEPLQHLVFDAGLGVDVTRGLPGTFIASGHRAEGATISTSSPGALLEYTSYEMFPGGTHGVARGPMGDLLVHGSPYAVIASTLPVQPGPIETHTLGCASSEVVADVVALDDGSFLVASSNNDPFDDCLDPDIPGPATTLQVHRVEQGGLITGHFRTLATALERIQLAPDDGQGAWLLHRSIGDATLYIERLDAEGQTTYSFSTTGNAIYGDAVDDWSTGFVHVNTWPGSPDNETPPFVWLSVNGPDFINQVTTLDFPQPISVMQRPPAVLTSPDQRSFLVAWSYAPSTIALLRGECQ